MSVIDKICRVFSTQLIECCCQDFPSKHYIKYLMGIKGIHTKHLKCPRKASHIYFFELLMVCTHLFSPRTHPY